MRLFGNRARNWRWRLVSGPAANGRTIATQSTSSGFAPAIARQEAIADSGKAPERYWRETLISSTAATSLPFLTTAAAASLRIPPIPKMEGNAMQNFSAKTGHYSPARSDLDQKKIPTPAEAST